MTKRFSFDETFNIDFRLLFNQAKKYSQALRDAANIPVDIGDDIVMKLPAFADDDRIIR